MWKWIIFSIRMMFWVPRNLLFEFTLLFQYYNRGALSSEVIPWSSVNYAFTIRGWAEHRSDAATRRCHPSEHRFALTVEKGSSSATASAWQSADRAKRSWRLWTFLYHGLRDIIEVLSFRECSPMYCRIDSRTTVECVITAWNKSEITIKAHKLNN